MNNSSLKQEVIKEYSEFLEGSVNPPEELGRSIKNFVSSSLDPNGWLVFSKLSLLHLASGLMTLSFCPQFGVSIFGYDYGLTKYLFQLGPYGCTFACGAIFIGITILLASISLSKEEVNKIRKQWILQLLSIALLSLGSFLVMDAEILISFGIAWMIGGLIGGMAVLEAGAIVRRNILNV